MALKWRVIRTEPRAEYLAAGELGREGFEVFFPRVIVAHPRLGHTDTPLFPGYLFLRCDPDADGWPVFRPAHRVLGWVRFGGEVPSLPEEFVGDLNRRLESANGGEGLWRRFRPGEVVRVVSDSIEGFAQVVEEAKSPRARAKVLLEFMGRLVQAQVPWDSLRPVANESYGTYRQLRRTRGKGRWIRGFGSYAGAGA